MIQILDSRYFRNVAVLAVLSLCSCAQRQADGGSQSTSSALDEETSTIAEAAGDGANGDIESSKPDAANDPNAPSVAVTVNGSASGGGTAGPGTAATEGAADGGSIVIIAHSGEGDGGTTSASSSTGAPASGRCQHGSVRNDGRFTTTNTPCFTDWACNDGDFNTWDRCAIDTTVNAVCAHRPRGLPAFLFDRTGSCAKDSDCDDRDSFTTDVCILLHEQRP